MSMIEYYGKVVVKTKKRTIKKAKYSSSKTNTYY